jgi:hypothetical protein
VDVVVRAGRGTARFGRAREGTLLNGLFLLAIPSSLVLIMAWKKKKMVVLVT